MDKIVNDNNDLNTDVTIKPAPKNWLQRLKEESWEAELLVSAIAIFGTFQLFGLIDWAANKFIDILNPNQYLVGYGIVFMGLLAVSILVSMFVVHFFLRAYWIGLVGLNSVFADYNIEDSPYSKIYTRKLVGILPKLEHSIKKVDDLCSVIFSAAFTFLLIYSFLSLMASIYLLVFNLLSSYVSVYILLIPLALFILVLLLQSVFGIIANIKKNKENVKLQTFSFNLVKYGSMVLYGPLYKSILQVTMIFGSNFKKQKSLIYLVLISVLFGAMMSIFQLFNTNIPYLMGQKDYVDSTVVYSDFYETENYNNNFLLTPEIESDRIKTNLLKLFIPIFSNEKNRRQNNCETYTEDSNKSKQEQRREIRVNGLECYKSYHLIMLNGENVSVDFLRYEHPRTHQFGILGYLDLTNVKTGKNIITIKKQFIEKGSKEWKIPFYYSSK